MKVSAWTLIFAAWLTASVASLGALFLGEVMGLLPCVLCWYQRIFMFPLVVILAIGLFPFDPKVLRYALPLAGVGLLISLFQVLLVAGVIPKSMTPCTQGIPCGSVQIEWFGFVTIPLLSFLAFLVIVALLLASVFKAPK
jgi:disulfide bond formation protein DsbB